MDNIEKRLKRSLKAVKKAQRIGHKRITCKNILRGECSYNAFYDDEKEALTDAFFTELEYRQKKPGDVYDWQKLYFYQATNGRLAYVSRSHVNKLLRDKKIVNRKATTTIPKGVVVKHRRVLSSFTNGRCEGRFSCRTISRLESYFDEQKPCKMIIDKKFDVAYAPQYNENFCTDGDKATGTSCMSCRGADAQKFYGGIEGCSVARFETDDGEQVGRCIVYEYDGIRHFIRVYAKGCYQRTCLNFIEKEMKENDIFGRGDGILRMRLKTDWTGETPNMYLDGNHYGISRVGDEYLISTDYDFDGKSTSSCSIEEVMDDCDGICDHCGRRCYEDDEYFWIGDYCYCCTDCARADGYMTCSNCGEWVYEDDAIKTEGDEVFCCSRCAEQSSFYKCPVCNKYTYDDNLYESEDGYVQMCDLCLEGNTKYCLDDDERFIVNRQLTFETTKD